MPAGQTDAEFRICGVKAGDSGLGMTSLAAVESGDSSRKGVSKDPKSPPVFCRSGFSRDALLDVGEKHSGCLQQPDGWSSRSYRRGCSGKPGNRERAVCTNRARSRSSLFPIPSKRADAVEQLARDRQSLLRIVGCRHVDVDGEKPASAVTLKPADNPAEIGLFVGRALG
jgi:hypothetical protein